MTTIELIPHLNPPNKEVKEQVESILKEAYLGIQELRKMSLDKTLTLEYIEEVEKLFLDNQFDAESLKLPKYLQKYAQCLSSFWNSYIYYKGMRSKGIFNLFTSLKEEDLALKVFHSEGECTKVLRKMEDYWMASNQIYTMYLISLIKKDYLR
jgi:hypothetical protein